MAAAALTPLYNLKMRRVFVQGKHMFNKRLI